MAEALRVALAGLGTVGAGVVKLIDANRSLIERRAGRPIEVVAVSAVQVVPGVRSPRIQRSSAQA